METIGTYSFQSCGKQLCCWLTTMQVDDCDAFSYTTYGATFTDQDGNVLVQYMDISIDRGFVEEFIHRCVKGEVSDIHIADVLEDCLF